MARSSTSPRRAPSSRAATPSRPIELYLREGHPAADVTLALRIALDLRRQLDTLTRERADVEQRRDDLQTSVAEARENLLAIQRNAQAADLRAQLTARLDRGATQLDQFTRRIVDLDTHDGLVPRAPRRDRARHRRRRVARRPPAHRR